MSEAWNAAVLMSAHTNAAAAAYHHHPHHHQPHVNVNVNVNAHHLLYNYEDYDAAAAAAAATAVAPQQHQHQRPRHPTATSAPTAVAIRQQQQQPQLPTTTTTTAVNVYDLSTDQLRRVLTLLIGEQPGAVNESIGAVLGLGIGVNVHAYADADGTGTAAAAVPPPAEDDDVVAVADPAAAGGDGLEQVVVEEEDGTVPDPSEVPVTTTGAVDGGGGPKKCPPKGGRKRSRAGAAPAARPKEQQTLASVVRTETGDENKPKRKKRKGGRNPWLRHYEELKEFYEENGHCRLTIGYKPNPSLGRWCDNQRQAHRRYVKIGPSESWLDPDRIKLLEDIGFEWRLSKVEIRPWEDRYRELVEYREKYGHTRVPASKGTTGKKGEHASLGAWVSSQRANFNQGRISQDKIDKLDAIGFDWRINDPYVPWNDRLEELKAFREEHGHFDVPYLYKNDPNNTEQHPHYSLGMWLYQQKTQYKLRKAGKKHWLSDDRVAALSEIGFDWEGTRMTTMEENWDQRYEELKAYKEKFGTCHMNSMHTKDKDSEYRALSRWYWLQSSQYRKHVAGQRSTMTAERLAKLDALEFHQAVFGPRKGKTGNGTLRAAVKAEVAKKLAAEKERKAKRTAAARARRLSKGKIKAKRGKGDAAKESNRTEKENDTIPDEAENEEKVMVDAPACTEYIV